MATLFLGSQLMVARGDDRSTPVDAPGPKYERQPSRRIGGGAYIAPERLPISESGHFYCSFPDSRRWRRTGSARVFVKSHSRRAPPAPVPAAIPAQVCRRGFRRRYQSRSSLPDSGSFVHPS